MHVWVFPWSPPIFSHIFWIGSENEEPFWTYQYVISLSEDQLRHRLSILNESELTESDCGNQNAYWWTISIRHSWPYCQRSVNTFELSHFPLKNVCFIDNFKPIDWMLLVNIMCRSFNMLLTNSWKCFLTLDHLCYLYASVFQFLEFEKLK